MIVEQAVKQPAGREMKVYAGKHLTFLLAKEQYGICISLVREIIGVMPVTSIPKTPDYVKGVVNLRGRVVPVVDLRQRLGLPLAELTDKSCIIVAEIDRPTGILVIGLLVDAVAEVINIHQDDITPPPDFGASIRIEYIRGIARTENSVRILLDIQRILTAGDAEILTRTTDQQSI